MAHAEVVEEGLSNCHDLKMRAAKIAMTRFIFSERKKLRPLLIIVNCEYLELSGMTGTRKQNPLVFFVGRSSQGDVSAVRNHNIQG